MTLAPKKCREIVEAVDAIPNAGWYQILAFMVGCEVWRVNKLKDAKAAAKTLKKACTGLVKL